MEKFKIKSIEEFDVDFVAKYNQPAAVVPEAEIDSNINIDDLAPKTQPDNETVQVVFENTQPESPVPSPAQQQIPRQTVPVQPKPENKSDAKKKPEKAKQSGLAIAGKVIATILLAATVVTFIFGCFVSVFLDNNNLDIGISLTTVNADTMNSAGDNAVTIVSKGDMILSTKPDANEYFDILNEAKLNDESLLITYSSDPTNENSYSDVYYVKEVIYATESSAVLSATNLTSPAPGYQSIEISSDDKSYHGVIKLYAPALGGILHFASDYAILVCILFILMAAFWCLVLVLIDNQRNKTKKTKEKAKK